MIQLHRLEGFYWVARTEGYARAARAFPYPITQPAVHQQVKKLEADLGTTLFERVGKDRMALTPGGRRLFEFVKPFFEQLPGVVRSLEEGEYGGELRIQTAGLILRHVMPEWIKRIHRTWPDIRVHLVETPTPELEPLRTGEVDLLVDHLPDVPGDLATMRVATVHPFLAMPREHAKARRKTVPIAQMQDDTFISYPPGSFHHDLQMQALARYGIVPRHVISASSADAILGFVEAGLGYSLVPHFDPSGPRVKGVVVMPLDAPRVDFPVYAAWRKDTPENPLLDAALEAAPAA